MSEQQKHNIELKLKLKTKEDELEKVIALNERKLQILSSNIQFYNLYTIQFTKYIELTDRLILFYF